MHIDARTLTAGTVIEGDICIIGAGAAGISMALEWRNSASRVLLLEGGGFELESEMQDLYRGNQNAGNPYYPLEAARLHYFGGTTGHWAGYCSPLEEIDLQSRDWVPHSGWPISLEDLQAYYPRAQNLLDLGPYQYDVSYWQARDQDLVPLSLTPNFWTKIWQFSPPTRFGTRYRDEVMGAHSIQLLTYANVVELIADQGVTTITSVRARTPSGLEFLVKARCFVLACGAIENARLLLVSNKQASQGLGNDYDQVGRYFMDHLEMPGANMVLRNPNALKLYVMPDRIAGKGSPARGELAVSAAMQRANKILSGTAEIRIGLHSEKLSGNFQTYAAELLQTGVERREEAERISFKYFYDRIMWRLFPDPEPQFTPLTEFKLLTRQEQAPNPDSRVTVNHLDVDAMGMPRITLDWRLTELDKYSIRRFYELLGQALGQTGQGRVQILDWLLSGSDTEWPEFLSGGWHHMGTTRMHSSPSAGVVDADCRVHGLENLYVAGSSVFTTSGAPNPTLTLVALSLRLADHLKREYA